MDTAHPQSRGRIVVAEDDLATRMLLSHVLRRNNFEVTEVDNGQAAVEAVERLRPQIVILDWHMPIMDGWQAITRLKSDPQTRGIPIIMLTSQSEIDEKTAALDAGAQDFISKPFDQRELLARIDQQLHWRELLDVDANAAFTLEKMALLEKSEQRYRLLAEAMPTMIFTADAAGNKNFANRSWIEYTGVRFDGQNSCASSGLVHPDEEPAACSAWTRAIADGMPFEMQIRLRRQSDQAYRWHVVRVNPLRDEVTGISNWVCTCADIHDYRLANETRVILDGVAQMMLMRDDDGFVEYVNPRWLEYTGSSLEGSRELRWLNYFHPAERGFAKRSFGAAALAAGPPLDYEARIADAQGQYRWFLIRTALVDDGDGPAHRWLSSCTDIEELKRSQSTLAALYETERENAIALQRAFAPRTLPTVAGLSFHAAYAPVSHESRVGGDWYDVFELPDGRVIFTIGDVAGHGLEAALVMIRARQSITALAIDQTDPGFVLNQVNEILIMQEPKLVTAIFGYIDPTTREIAFAVAGHPPPIIASPGRPAAFVESRGVALGVWNDLGAQTYRLQAACGDTFFVYTDGITEFQRSNRGGEERLLAAVTLAVGHGAPNPAEDVYESLFGTDSALDDATILAISFD